MRGKPRALAVDLKLHGFEEIYANASFIAAARPPTRFDGRSHALKTTLSLDRYSRKTFAIFG
jgi:hypothetical protein